MKPERKLLYLSLLLAGAALLLAGCIPPDTSSHAVRQDLDRPLYTPIPVVPHTPKEGSIFDPDSVGNLVADFRAKRIGDVLTVKIEEDLKGSKNVDTKTDRKSDATLGLTGIFGFEFEKRLDDRYPNVSAKNALGGSGKNNFQGKGATTRDTSLKGTISVRVMQVLPGGNLLVRGTREISINNETQYIILSGIVRPADIEPGNVISSTRIADARIAYTGSGVLADGQQPGWMTRLMSRFSPF